MPHTPEPWTWCGTDPGHRDFETGRWEDPPQPAAVIAGEGDELPDEENVIAWANDHMPPETQEANVRLMHAAPKLLAACEVIEQWWLDGEMQKHYGAPAWIFMVREALAAAKGGVPSGGS